MSRVSASVKTDVGESPSSSSSFISGSVDEKLLSGMKKFFGFSDFKSELQKKAVKAVVEGNQSNRPWWLLVVLNLTSVFFNVLGNKNVYVSMPTGSGKSLVYMLPAALQERKFAIVICPLIALIQV